MYVGIAIGILIGIFLGRSVFSPKKGVWNSAQAVKYAKEGREVVQKRIARRKEKIMIFAVREGRVVNDDVEDMFCISNNTAANYLAELVEDGRLHRSGEGRGTYYEPLQ